MLTKHGFLPFDTTLKCVLLKLVFSLATNGIYRKNENDDEEGVKEKKMVQNEMAVAAISPPGWLQSS